MMGSKERLAEAIARGASFDYVFFWGHTPKAEGVVDSSCFSQWFPRAFTVDGLQYASAEHFMMAGKARLFGDESAAAGILSAATPADAKALGRAVRGFDERRGVEARAELVARGNVAKFAQHEDLRRQLLGTGEKVLVEASPRDAIWGIGMGASNPDARNPARWRGLNLLGFALMEARERIRDLAQTR
jgi:ribA/ribD-fused uncharacterized protein